MPKHPATAQSYYDSLTKNRPAWNAVPGHLTFRMLQFYRSLRQRPPAHAMLEKYITHKGAFVAHAVLTHQQLAYQMGSQTTQVAQIGRWLDAEDLGKLWMLGCVSKLLRGDDIQTVAESDPNLVIQSAIPAYVKIIWHRLYERRLDAHAAPRLPNNSVWELFDSPTVTNAQLTLLHGKVAQISIQSWGEFNCAQRGNHTFGRLWAPKKINLIGHVVQLGWELIADWLAPKDQDHGIELVTIGWLLNKLKRQAATNAECKPSKGTRTDGMQVEHNGQWYVLAYYADSNDWVLTTCYTIPARNPNKVAIDNNGLLIRIGQ